VHESVVVAVVADRVPERRAAVPDLTRQGRGRVDLKAYDLSDPEIARANGDGAEGWGLSEHATIGRHDPTGFKDFTSVAVAPAHER
jgi:hypothetical protein